MKFGSTFAREISSIISHLKNRTPLHKFENTTRETAFLQHFGFCTMMHPSQMNNAAVKSIEAKKYDVAITMLTKSLKMVKLVMSGDFMISGKRNSDCDDLRVRNGMACDFVRSTSSSFERTFENGGICSGSIFCDPICMASVLPSEELEKCEVLSYVILYNLALSYHLRGMDEEEHHLKVAYLQKALTLYEHAHHILSSQDIELSLLHTMAIASNLGHIHHVVGDEQRAQMCFQHLLSTILYVVDCGEGSKIETFDGFFRNVMSLICTSSPAPAA